MDIHPIAHIRSGFPAKFGIPRQSGLVEGLEAVVVMEPEYRIREAFRGLEAFSHVWLLWEFSGSLREGWSPTVRPPRLGGNARMGVFATRSPFRPNPIGLSSVALNRVELESPLGPLLHVSGADLMDGTPIYDIKPYLPFTDSHPDAEGGFAAERLAQRLDVEIPDEWLDRIPLSCREPVREMLAQDPRPSYHRDASRRYGFVYAGLEIRFRVEEGTAVVEEVLPAGDETGKNSEQ
ncbi:MAG: tRNA (N6-threonylcarbamoyladenosine(37)-N6)-methyltransferase TrmO [Bacteroidales bacterium]|nr:tRNA (N6-threonylcarbamoyladenosine(37)-N6)-methyltransferase TrmO [Bacteroidales bacterium]